MERMLSNAGPKQLILFVLMLILPWGRVSGIGLQDPPEIPSVVLDSLPDEARANLDQLLAALGANPGDSVLLGQTGMVLHAHDRLDLAEQYYALARSLSPEDFEWGYYLATVQNLQGKNSEAIATLRAIILPDEPYVPAQLKLGQLLFEANQWEESARIAKEVLSRFPDLAVAHYALGRALNGLGQTREAAGSFEKACEIYPKYGPAHYAAALAYRELGDEYRAKEHFSLYRENRLTRPGIGDGYLEAINALKSGSRLAYQHLEKARELGERNQFQEAIAENKKALEADPQVLQAHVNLIILYGRVGEIDKATDHYQKAIQVNRDYADTYYNYGVLMLNQQRYREAKDAFSETIQINPYHAQAQNNLGQVLELEGSLEEALKHFEAACASDRTSRTAQFNRGRVLVALSRFEEGIEAFKATLEPEDERTARYLYALGAAYVRSGDLENGLQYTEKAKALAERYQLEALLPPIDRDLEKLKKALNR